jgi:lysophospholipase L1-like esterase
MRGLLAAGVLIAAASMGANAEGPCKAPKELVSFAAPLPNLVRVFNTRRAVKIVTLGSSSTAGSGASGPNASYPARLDADLDARYRGHEFQVTNLGAGGQLASDMLERLELEVVSQAPALVIWQTGVNDAIQDVGVDKFRETLKTGIARLKEAAIDVILVDMQYYPRSERVAGYGDYLAAMRKVAEEEKIPLFRRFLIMKHFLKSGQYTSDQLLAPDNFHLNDLSYGCLAVLLADAIETQLARAQILRDHAAPSH